jgi:hypothetical protein
MRCVYCGEEISDYRLVNLDIVTNNFPVPFPSIPTYGSSKYVGVVREVALLECPHCDMTFFVKANSQKLSGMNIILPANPNIAASTNALDYDKMTAEEKRALYEKIKGELIAKYVGDPK